LEKQMFKLFLFGPPRIERHGRTVELGLRKATALLAYLAANKKTHGREALATMLWPDADHGTGLGRLRRAVHRVNSSLGAQVLTATREQVQLNPQVGLWLDVDEFRLQADEGRATAGAEAVPSLTRAAELYVDHFLSGFTLPDSVAFDDWQFFQAESIRRLLDEVLVKLTGILGGQREWEPAIASARRRVLLDPLQETAHAELMMLYAQAGEQAAALRQYEQCRRILEAELGIAPRPETTALYQAIKAKAFPQRAPAGGPGRPAVVLSPGPARDLPVYLHPYVGRAQELAGIRHLLAGGEDRRLLTLTGPGGIGKTHLAVEASRGVAESFPDGVHFVCLASVGSASRLLAAIAERVGLHVRDKVPAREQLLAYLSDKCMLLILDNFDDLLPDARFVAHLLEAAPRLKVLVTSGERLNLAGESVYVLDGLATPATGDAVDVQASDGIQMFLQYARLAHPRLEILAADVEHAARICRLVQGMPLALMLAAGWLEVLSFREIADEIAHNLDFLETPLRNVPERHRSVRAAFQHAWDRLPPADQRVYRWLSVFRGGFTRQAARHVAGAGPHTLRRLGDKSLISLHTTRYGVHELLRRFASDCLEAAGEKDEAQRLHALYFLKWTAGLELDPTKPGAWRRAVDEIEADLGNIRAAWSWALRRGQEAALQQSARSLQPFFDRSHCEQEVVRFFEAFPGRQVPAAEEHRAKGWRGPALA
jgi:predicted ATPase/DNA-binding SARP family transcriptional activator